MRPAARRGRPWAWVLAAGLVMVAAARAHGAADDVRAMSAQVSGPRLAWLSAAVGAQIVSLAGGAAAQRQLLVIGNTRLPWRALFGLVLGRADVKAPRLQHGDRELTWILIEDAVRRGLGTRVGLEDTLYLPDGSPARNNADLVTARWLWS